MFPGQLYKTESGRLFHAGAIAIIFVGLPARGKTHVSRSLSRYLRWLGVQTSVFSVGNYRRQIIGVEVTNDFFSPMNKETADLRLKIANACLDDMIRWFAAGGQCGILDGSNTTEERRRELVERFKSVNVHYMFIESICDNPTIIDSNIRSVKVSSPDYVGWKDVDAVQDFKRRIENHMPFYVTIEDKTLSWVKLINVGEKIIVNNVHGFLQSKIVYYLMNLHISPRKIYFARYAENLKNFVLKLRENQTLLSPAMTTAEAPRQLTVWTSARKRSFQTAAHFLDHEDIIVRQRSVLGERHPGVCDQMTPQEIEKKYPDECLRSKNDPYRHRFPRAESYYDLANRLEKVILELEREKNDVLIIAHESVIKCLYGYLFGLSERSIPSLEIPENVLLELVPRAYATEETRHVIPDTLVGINWQHRTANLLSLAGKVPSSPMFMDHYLPDDKRKGRPGSNTAFSTPSSSPSLSSTAVSEMSPGIQHRGDLADDLGHGPEGNFRFFSTSARCTAAIEKKALNKKITLPRDPYLLSEKVVKFAKNGKLDDAITLVMEAPKSRQNEVVWNHLIQESSKLGKINQSWQLLNDMKKRGFEPSERTFTILLNSLAINASSPNSVVRARALYQQLQDSEDLSPTTVHTNALLKVCTRQHDYTALQEVYASMSKSGENAPDVITYSTVINAYARKGGDEGFEMAWRVWEDLVQDKARRGEDVELDSKIVDAVLLACRGAKSAVFVKRGYKLVESLYGLPASSSTSGPGAGTGTGTGAGSGSGPATATERAISPTKSLGLSPGSLRKETIHPRTVELLLSICSNLKDYTRATHYMTLIRSYFPDFTPDPQLLSSLMHLQISNKQYDTAITTWDEISEGGLQHTPGTFKQGLDAALKARNWDKTQEMYTLMRELIEKNKKLNSSSSSSDLHRANTLVNPLVRSQDAWTLVSTLKCAVKTNHKEEGLEILRKSRWTKVVQNPQYPRANADLADLAVKILAGSMKSHKEAFDRITTSTMDSETIGATTTATATETATTTEGGDSFTTGSQERHEQEMERLKRELSDARAIQTQMTKTLADHDAGKAAQKEIEDVNRFRNRRSPSSSTESSSVSSRYGSSSRESSRYTSRSDNNDEDEGDRLASGGGGGGSGGWRKVSAEEYTESNSNNNNNNKHQKSWTRKDSTSTSSSSYSDRPQTSYRGGAGGRSGSSYSPRRYQRDNYASVNDAFTPRRRFTRTIDE
ncbi:hypothetical protein EC957_010103 [Mortierella hygrophila]|uniref:6-phosphofructo-2-kinase domain-containing protein n=1 Tax=Mortierella hygrophila TaxID=979708 RepID=A0A9P6FHM0_9FUNG|nr:hypothetical protein EC957_010103 [Mortierella hygrophila]